MNYKNKLMDKIILIVYVNVAGLTRRDAEETLARFAVTLSENQKDIIHYIIPVFEGNPKVECVNPKLVGSKKFKKVKETLDKATSNLKKFMEGAKITE